MGEFPLVSRQNFRKGSYRAKYFLSFETDDAQPPGFVQLCPHARCEPACIFPPFHRGLLPSYPEPIFLIEGQRRVRLKALGRSQPPNWTPSTGIHPSDVDIVATARIAIPTHRD